MKKQNLIITGGFFTLCAGLAIASILLPDQEISISERRKLTSFPEVTLASLANGKFGSSFEDYALDHLAFRDAFLDLRSLSGKYLFGNLDDNGIVEKEGSLIHLERKNENSVEYAAQVFERVWNKYLKDTDCKVYLSIIPDKAYFLQDDHLAVMDYDAFLSDVCRRMDYAKYIDITHTLSLEDYYHTDPHWKQENLEKAVQALAQGMDISLASDYQQYCALENFTGTYAGQSALPAAKDALNVLYNPEMDDWHVYSYEKGKQIPVYNEQDVKGLDPYNVFLSGNTGLLKIENPHGQKGRRLVVFKDSFGSSLLPLLLDGYEEAYIVDLRSLPSFQVGRYITFTDQDVLFLYSTSVLNNSNTLK